MNNNKKRNLLFVVAGLLMAILVYGGITYGVVYLFNSETEIEGTVLDEGTKTPLSNVLVEFKSDNKNDKTIEPVYTNKDGHFEAIVDGKYTGFPVAKKENYRVVGCDYDLIFKRKKYVIYLGKIK